MIPLTPVGLILLVLALLGVLLAPRRWAPVPMLMVASYMTLAQGVMLGPLNFYSIRLVILTGLIRVFMRGEYHALPRSPLDRLMLAWSILALAASAFRSDPVATLIYNGGLVFNYLGSYFLLRVAYQSRDDVIFLCRVVAWMLVPVALEMVYEQLADRNLFSIFGGVSEVPEIREGRIRAQGPFSHAILAGTVGAGIFPICIGLLSRRRGVAIVGTVAAITMVLTSASSGPKVSALCATLGLLLWIVRHQVRLIRWGIIFTFVLLMLVMKSPPYYLMARIDLTGGSTGWYRARLIESSLEHLNEWWLGGTDYTRHWMESGVGWSPNHVDITNHYLMLGVQGGLPLLLIFILLLAKAFSAIGRTVRLTQKLDPKYAFFCWSLGVSLFAHVASAISVTYFGQSFMFLNITLAAIAGASTSALVNPERQRIPFPLSGAVVKVYRRRAAIRD